MRAVDLIEKTKRRQPLTQDELTWLVDGVTRGTVPDYQLAAWLMAVVLRGLAHQETAGLTRAMVESGERLDLALLGIHAVDKHSTGGVGDKTTLVLAPMLAAAGLTVAKMSGRGLGFTGGTLDKLESIPGVRVELARDELVRQARDVGLVIAGQSPTMAPADGKLYALRDVTATVDSIPLIASSIMSKKLAAGATSLVLDVKTGSGAFMETLEGARDLASTMVEIGRHAGLRVAAVISSMAQPLGRAVGNALEVREAVEALSGRGPRDLLDLCTELGVVLMQLSGMEPDAEHAAARLRATIHDGSALERLRRMVAAQGGDPEALDSGSDLLPRAAVTLPVFPPSDGYVHGVEAKAIGLAAVALGAGRAQKGDPIDHAAGIVVHARIGDAVRRQEPLATIHARTPDAATAVAPAIASAFRLGVERVPSPPLILERVLPR